MNGNISLRQGSSGHYAFALDLYLTTMRPYTAQLMAWDELKQCESFAAQWNPAEVQIIALDGVDVGWLQISEASSEICLKQFFNRPDRQRSGIGTEVMSRLVAAWRSKAKPVTLTVLKNNPARRLYERFEFSVVVEAGVKFEMKRRF